METLEGILSAHPFFHDLPPRHLGLLIGCASNVRFEPGQFLFRTGEEANQFFLIRHGRVALEITAPGRRPLTLQTLGEGEILGWTWLIPPYHWMFDAQAIEQTRAVALDGRCLRGKCEADHDLGYELLKRFAQVMEQRLVAARLQLLDVYGTDA
jgi:CRP/FNR family cyclic AMP-dependent transcriptional regulator